VLFFLVDAWHLVLRRWELAIIRPYSAGVEICTDLQHCLPLRRAEATAYSFASMILVDRSPLSNWAVLEHGRAVLHTRKLLRDSRNRKIIGAMPLSPAAELSFLSIEEASRLLRARKISPVELTEAVLGQVSAWNPSVNAFITVLEDAARRHARRAEQDLRRKRPSSPLHGIPISLKDNIYTKGIRTTAGSKILFDFLPAADSAIAAKLAQSGAILLGKTNLHEFAYGITSENPHFGAVRNPWDTSRVAGGSSGGSAAAVATGMGLASVGTDTAGSTRIPPAFCGVVGLKPTAGLIDLSGVVPLSVTCDTGGLIARSVADTCILLEALAGPYPKKFPRPDFKKLRKHRPRRFRVGWPEQHFFNNVDPEVRRRIDEAVKCLCSLGGAVAHISLPHVSDSLEAGTSIQMPEASYYHQSQGYFPQRADEYGSDVRGRLELGLQVKASDYLRALDTKRVVEAEFGNAFKDVDVIVAPASPIPAPLLGENEVEIAGGKYTVRALVTSVNRPLNVSGNPALSIPCGFTDKGLPVGLQLIGPRWGEANLLAIAQSYEEAAGWRNRHPKPQPSA
jgi:aspartyl-tRNA(Asn)/glutamyl-tRNA(Gln) amidotransferase subunit A